MLYTRDRSSWLDEDGECIMCERGEWPLGAVTCPICDAETPDDLEEYAEVRRERKVDQ